MTSRQRVERFRRHLPWLVAAAAVALLGLAVSPDTDAAVSRMGLLAGRMHPMLVHLPIGFLLLAGVLELLGRQPRLARVRHAVPVALCLGAAGAIAAVAAGQQLMIGGGYAGDAVERHRWLGMGVALGAIAAAALRLAPPARRTPGLRRAYTGALAGTLLLLGAAGHLGGSLTHGPDYVTEHLPNPARRAVHLLTPGAAAEPAFARLDDVDPYHHLVRPLLQQRCVSCHGPDRQRGGLRLDSPDAMREGGESGPAVVAGRPGDSELIRRIWLPQGHDEHMPPRGRKPLTVAEAELLRWWIEQGAPFGGTPGVTDPPPVVLASLEQIAGPLDQRFPPILRAPIAPADSAALSGARAAGVAVRPLSLGSAFVRASCMVADRCGAAQLRALLPLAEQTADLDLRGAALSDADLATVGRLRHLTRLHLERTGVTDQGLAHLDSLRHLEYLNLHGTRVTDRGLQRLGTLTSLRSLFVWQTAVTPEGVRKLRERLPRLRVSAGMDAATLDSLRAEAGPDTAVGY